MDYLALKNELVGDPKGYGYAQYLASGSDWVLADMLNQVRDSIRIDRTFVNAYEIIEAIRPIEWSYIEAEDKWRFQLILGMGQVYIKGTNTREILLEPFPNYCITWSNIMALTKRSGSRAEELFGEGAVVTSEDVNKARRLWWQQREP